MKIENQEINSHQTNFLKELMGDVYMSDIRLGAKFLRICGKYGVDQEALLKVINKDFMIRNAIFKKIEAEELGLED